MTPTGLPLLAADSELLKKISKGFNEYLLEGPVPVWVFLGAIGLAVAGAVAWHYLAPHYLKSRETEALFKLLCERQEMGPDEVRWLRDLADREGIENPATIFLLPTVVSKARREELESLAGGARDAREIFLARLQVRLFE